MHMQTVIYKACKQPKGLPQQHKQVNVLSICEKMLVDSEGEGGQLFA